MLGAGVPDRDVERILRSLGLEVAAAADGWDAVAPTFRVDLLREVDLIEEVGRHYGFDRLEAAFPPLTQPAPPPDARIGRDRTVRRVLTAAGLSEAVTFGFVESKAAAPFEIGPARTVGIANPLSAKFDTLRPSLLPGLVDAVAHNRRHGRRDVAALRNRRALHLERRNARRRHRVDRCGRRTLEGRRAGRGLLRRQRASSNASRTPSA